MTLSWQACEESGRAAGRRIRVLLADDHLLVRSGVSRLLSEEPDIDVCGEAGSPAQLREQLRHQACDVLILDLSLAGGLVALHELRTHFPKLPVLALSAEAGELLG